MHKHDTVWKNSFSNEVGFIRKKKHPFWDTNFSWNFSTSDTVKRRVGPKNRVDFKAQLCSNTVRDKSYLGQVWQRLYNGIRYERSACYWNSLREKIDSLLLQVLLPCYMYENSRFFADSNLHCNYLDTFERDYILICMKCLKEKKSSFRLF